MNISAIITTYKRPITILKRAIDSIINQTYDDYEILVVNDYPEDENLSNEIRELVSSYSRDNMVYLSYDRNRGACFARNFGITHAKGSYIAFLDDDDEWLPCKLAIQEKAIERYEADMVFNPIISINNNGRTIVRNCQYSDGIVPDIFKKLLVSNCIGSTSMPLIRKELIIRSGMFDERLGSSQDLDMWIRISLNGKIAFDSTPVIKYSISEDSITKSLKKKIDAFEYINEKYKDYYTTNKGIYNERLNNMSCTCIGYYHSFYYGLKYWFKAIRILPFSKNNIMIFDKVWSFILNHKRYSILKQ